MTATTHIQKRGEMPTFTREEQLAYREQLKANTRARQLPEPSKAYVERFGRDALLAEMLDNPNRILGTVKIAPAPVVSALKVAS